MRDYVGPCRVIERVGWLYMAQGLPGTDRSAVGSIQGIFYAPPVWALTVSKGIWTMGPYFEGGS